jgi:hypothetical protein
VTGPCSAPGTSTGRERRKKLLATLFATPGTIRLGARAVTVRLMPGATHSERAALRAFPRGHRP